MIFRIPSGKHRARPRRFGLYRRKTLFTWLVKFDESCRYDLGNDDQGDTNKLCGVGYLPHHHKNSARFGWRYDTKLQQIELLAYCYVDGRRVIHNICFIDLGKEYRIKLQVLGNCYYFDVYEPGSINALGVVFIDHYHSRKLKYRLGCYFGGDKVAPHEMKIQIEKV